MKKPENNQFIVAYIDILGFKEYVKNHPREQVRNILKFAQHVGRNTRSSNPCFSEFHFKAFSDNVSMSLPVDKISFISFLLHLVHFQAQLADRAVFLRGAIVVGEHFEDGNVLFGQSLIRAVDLERNIAIWPRIIVDPNVISLAYSLGLYLDKEPLEGDISPLLQIDYDGIRYLNYLGHFLQSPQWHSSSQESNNFAAKHRDSITEQIEVNKLDLRVLAQYHWLASYHNNTMSGIGWHHLDIETSDFP